jgi:hypothetical protein
MVVATLAAAERAWDVLTGALAVAPPDADPDGAWHVYLVDGVDGASTALLAGRDPIAHFDRATSFALVDPVHVQRVSLLVWRVKLQENVLSLLASRMDLVEKRVAGQEPRVDGQELDLSLPSFFLELQVGRMELLAPDLEPLAERVELLVRDLDGHTHFLERHLSSMDRQSRTTAGRSGTTAGRSRKRLRCSKSVTRLSERRVRWQKRCGVDFRRRTVPIPSLPLCRERSPLTAASPRPR